jgi:hypothetical protein
VPERAGDAAQRGERVAQARLLSLAGGAHYLVR